MKKKYRLKCWVYVGNDDESPPLNKKEAQSELEQQEFLFPENKYEIEEI